MAEKVGRHAVLVVGIGRFGSAVAVELVHLGHEVLAMDASEQLVQSFASKVTHVVSGDATDPEVLAAIGIEQFSHAVVAIGDNMEASILSVAALAEARVPNIWAKAITASHARILGLVGATRTVFPERDMGIRMAHQVTGQMIDYVEIDDDFALVETGPPTGEVGKTLHQAQLRARHGVTVVAVKPEGGSFTYTTPDTVLEAGSVLLVAGQKGDVERFARTT